jgi:hypothetical protein
MPDDNRFAGIGDQLDRPERAEQDESETTVDETESATKTGDSGSTPDDEEGGPAFAFDETSAKSLYVRDGTLELFEDTEFEVEAALRADHEIRDLTSREFHDALVHVASEHVDEIATRIDAERSPDSSE